MVNLSSEFLIETKLELPLFYRGKIRDTYDLGNQLLIIATDRISAFDVVLPNGIPAKGRVLNQISIFWFRHTSELTPNHFLEAVDDTHCLSSYLPEGSNFTCPPFLIGRSMIVKKAERIPIECVVRGYLAGSAWAEYQKEGTVAGVKLPKGLKESQQLPQPMFTPTTKEDNGHDTPITKKEILKLVGNKIADELEERSLAVYKYARDYAVNKGIIIADTKFEFGIDNDKLILIDELLTPDSSRLWDADRYLVGQSQPSYDKQPVRDWLIASEWNQKPPAPMLPHDVIKATTNRYIQGYERLTGRELK